MTLLAQSEGTKGYAALSWWQTLITGSNRAPLATKHLIQCHITTPLLLRLYCTRWLGNINCYLSAADLLNVNAVPSSPLLSFPAFPLWLYHQITACLPSQVIRFLQRQAGTLPGLSLRFVSFSLAHLETDIWEYTKWKAALTWSGFLLVSRVIFLQTCPEARTLHCKEKHYYLKPNRRESQVSANKNHHTDAFLITLWAACLFIWHL